MSKDIDPNYFSQRLDPIHQEVDFFSEGMTMDIWRDKYRWKTEADFQDTAERVIQGIYTKDKNLAQRQLAYSAMIAGLWMPAGRILAGAGTGKRVTLMNCYVTGTIEDSMEGILREHDNFALTMQQGGGDGADFSSIRPDGAMLTRTHTKASGPLPFMDMWNSMCNTIRSAGDRRGAMMGVLSDTHPDLLKFIEAKHEKGRLTNFNISILVSDAFMEAIHEDAEWVLFFHVAPWERDETLKHYDFVDENGRLQYAYSVHNARELWERITKSTYEYSEPGVIFIDRVNELNNLWYCEEIRATNPCGEQPLPPHGTCNLGHVNLARMVRQPFTEDAYFDFDLLKDIVPIGVRFLDNVIDVTNYPLELQKEEQRQKRRIGLGFTGLADVFAMLDMRYGSRKSAQLAGQIQQTITECAYQASIELAEERGSFPLLDADKYLDKACFAGSKLPEHIKQQIRERGIRNGVINTVAPTGTSSIVYGNPAGGLEPIFAHHIKRNVRQADDTFKAYDEYGYAAKVWMHFHSIPAGAGVDWPATMVTAADLTVFDHVLIQQTVQEWVDASISKTINIPEEMPYEQFVQVYELAYSTGCKGCTTYRPSEVRGSILSNADALAKENAGIPRIDLEKRPEVLNGQTYQIKWPKRDAALYLTVNSREDGTPFEVFITSKDGSYGEWTTALSLMITAILRKGGDVSFIPDELKAIQSMHDGAWIQGRYVGSLPARIGEILDKHFNSVVGDEVQVEVEPTTYLYDPRPMQGAICPSCGAPTLTMQEGCKKCSSCGFSECG